MLTIGIGQGVQPLLGLCVGAKNWKRYNKLLKFSLFFAFAVSFVIPALIINLSRQGIVYIPALYILNIFASASVLMFAQPIADILSICLAAVLYISPYKN